MRIIRAAAVAEDRADLTAGIHERGPFKSYRWKNWHE
jgi:hypothetical protein